MTRETASIIWAVGLVAWFAIRLPYQRRARKIGVAADRRDLGDRFFLAFASLTLSLVPLVWVASGFPAAADHVFRPWMGWLGLLADIAFVWLFWASHRQLGRNWSITLEIRDEHRLVTEGLYRYVRHPMYSSFWLWALAQALLIPNWVAGLAGLVGVAGLYFSRVGKEERMMLDRFGQEYQTYCAATGRVIPKLFRPAR
jgi:protein-S-isoprenylcysteine O-methyltransferase Ste14